MMTSQHGDNGHLVTPVCPGCDEPLDEEDVEFGICGDCYADNLDIEDLEALAFKSMDNTQ